MTVPFEGTVPRRTSIIAAFALSVTLIAAVFSAFGIVKLVRGDDSGSAGGSVAAGAQTALTEGGQLAVDFTSFDYHTLNTDFTRTAAHATATFSKSYLAQSRAVASLIKKAKAVSTSQVVALGLKTYDATAGTATVLVALNDTTKNTKSPDGTVQYYRMAVSMVRQNGVWLASAVTPRMSTESDPLIETAEPDDAMGESSSLVSGSIALAVVMVLVLAVVTTFLSRHNSSDAGSSSYLLGPTAKAAAAAAETEVKATLTYNYKHLQADYAAAEKGLTARFVPSYKQTTATSVTPLATKYHATSSATVAAAGVSQAGSDTVKVLLFVDQTVTNTQLVHPRLDRSRIAATMVLVNGHWLVDNLLPL